MDKVDIIKKIIEDNPQDANAWYLLGLEYLEQKNTSEALKAFSESLRYSDNSLQAEVFQQLGKLGDGKPSQEEIPSTQPMVGLEQRNTVIQADVEASTLVDNETNKSQTEKQSLRMIEGGKKDNVVSINEVSKKVVTFDDVGGLDKLKETIKMKIIKPFLTPGLFERFKKKVGGGILLYGPPGCGKTFIAKATAGEVNAKFINVHISDILDPYLGVSEQNIKDIFDSARLHKPSVLFFDEIDAIGFNRAKSSSNLMRGIIDQLLSEIEGIESNTEKLLIIGATNMPWDVDPAFKRPGRFDKLIFVPPPDESARKVIFELKLTNRPIASIDYDILAKKTELYSGADIENVVEMATENVIEEIMQTGIERSLTTNDLVYAIGDSKPSTIDWLRTVKNYVKYSNQSGLYDDVEKFLATYKKFL